MPGLNGILIAKIVGVLFLIGIIIFEYEHIKTLNADIATLNQQLQTSKDNTARLQVALNNQNAVIAQLQQDTVDYQTKLRAAQAASLRKSVYYDDKVVKIESIDVPKTCPGAMQFGKSKAAELINIWKGVK